MKQFDFDDLLRHKLDKATLPAVPTDMDWGALSARLARRNRWRKWLIWGSLATVLLSLLGGNIFWLHQNQQLQAQISTLTTNGVETRQSKLIIDQVDTVVRRTTVILYDTIYRRVSLGAHNGSVSAVAENKLPQLSLFDQDRADKTAKTSAATPNTNGTVAVSVANIGNNMAASVSGVIGSADSLSAKTEVAAFGLLPNLPFKFLPLQKRKLDIDTDFFRASPTKVKHKYEPNIEAGLVFGAPIVARQDIESKGGVYTGLRATAQVWRRFSVTAEAGLAQLNSLRSDDLDRLPLGVNEPQVGSNLTFEEWRIRRMPSVNYALGVKFRLRPLDKKWSPYFLAGYHGATFGGFETLFEYRDESNEPVFFNQPSRHQAKDNFGGFWGAAGLDFRIKGRYNILLEADINQNLGVHQQAAMPAQVRLKAGLTYRF